MIIHKGERRLWAHCEGGAVVTLPVALGRGLAGPKRSQGDQRTPEGDYRLLGAAKSSRFHRFVAIDYPSPRDADRALAEAQISETDHARILDAHRRGVLPPSDTPLGGDIGFHGEGKRWRGESRDLDWTFGCIALRDVDVDFLIARAPSGTPVAILGAAAPVPEAPGGR
jgi:murein L,D-transpeptidase YafK